MGLRYEASDDASKLHSLQYVIYVFNTVFFVMSAIVFSVGLYVNFDENMNDVSDAVFLSNYNSATGVLMGAACLVMITSFVGCCGAYLQSRKIIIAYKVSTCLSFIALLASSAYILENGLEQSRLFPQIQKNFYSYIVRYQIDVSARRIVDTLQELIGCCGAYSTGDFQGINLQTPDTCRDHITGNNYGDSCAEVVSSYMEMRTGWMTGISLCLCFVQIFAICFSFCLYKQLRELKKQPRHNFDGTSKR